MKLIRLEIGKSYIVKDTGLICAEFALKAKQFGIHKHFRKYHSPTIGSTVKVMAEDDWFYGLMEGKTKSFICSKKSFLDNKTSYYFEEVINYDNLNEIEE